MKHTGLLNIIGHTSVYHIEELTGWFIISMKHIRLNIIGYECLPYRHLLDGRLQEGLQISVQNLQLNLYIHNSATTTVWGIKEIGLRKNKKTILTIRIL